MGTIAASSRWASIPKSDADLKPPVARLRALSKGKWMLHRRDLTFRVAPMIALVVLSGTGCGRHLQVPNWLSGNTGRGSTVIAEAGCGRCHRIDGIPGAVGTIGPPLNDFAVRTTIAGFLPNTTENLMHWIRYPQAVRPGNVMPDMGLTEQQARDAAAYLHSLK